jgi:hypothetical protein
VSPFEDEDLEKRLRAAFEPDAATVNRVAAAALRPLPRVSWVPRLAAAFILAGVVVGALFIWFKPPAVRAESVRLEYFGNVALLEYSDGSSWLVSPDTMGQGPQSPLNVIIIEGDNP